MIDLKFTEEDLAAKCITDLPDRPTLSAAALKERLDSGDIRARVNTLLDRLQNHHRLMIFEEKNTAALQMAFLMQGEARFCALFLDTGELFCGTAEDLSKELAC